MKHSSNRLTARIILFMLLSFVVIGSTSAYAWFCAPPPPTADALKAATAVFAGKVTKIEPQKAFLRITFAVSAGWKGKLDKTVDVLTQDKGVSTGFPFEVGKEFLVYAKQGESLDLYTHLCTRTKTLGDAAEDLKELGKPAYMP